MVNTTQIIGGYVVPLVDSIAMTKVSFDIENPQKRSTDFSKSIDIPSTAETNKLFENLFDVKIALQTFNPNLKTDYELKVDGVTILRGFCQLKEIKIVDGLIHYILNASGIIGDLFRSIGDAYLDELDFSTYDHTWNETNIVASWSPTLGEGYVYPMIDYGGKMTRIWYNEEFKPALFAKQYIDKIFTAAGYTYESTFFDSTRFKSLIIPQTSDTISMSDATIKARQFVVGRKTSNQTGISGDVLSNPSGMDELEFNDTSSPYYTPTSGAWSTTTYDWTLANNGRYSLKGFIVSSFRYTEVLSGTTAMFNSTMSYLVGAWITLAIVRERSSVLSVVDTITLDIFDEMDGETFTSSYTSPTFEKGFASADLDLESGDKITLRYSKIEFKWQYVSSSVTNTGWTELRDSDFRLHIGSQFGSTIRTTTINVGETMTMNDTIPPKVKQKDFLNAIIKRFNLFFEYDSDDNKNIIIETLDDYVTSNTEDLNGWVDLSKEKIIQPIGSLNTGEFVFKDKEDEDEWNKVYQTRKPDTYGVHRYDVGNDFLLNEKVIETIFSPCPLMSFPNDDKIISSIAFPKDINGFASEVALPKLLYWGGLLDTDYGWYLNISPKTTYPYAGHLDDPFDPNFDLNWGVPKLLFYDFSSGNQKDVLYTDKNCFNTYWKSYIEQISDKDSKILEIYMVLDSYRYDILSFRKQYFIDGVYWRLLEVQDFNPLNGTTTKCKFIKLTDVDAFTGEQSKIYGGEDIFTDGDYFPKYGTLVTRSGGSGSEETGINNGNKNQSGWQSVQNSDNVVGGSGVKQTFTSGSDGARMLAPQTAAINSPDIEIIRPNETFVNNVYLEKKVVRVLTATEMKSMNTSPIFLIDAPRSDEYIRVTRGYIRIAGTAFTGTNSLEVRTRSTNSILAQTDAAFFSIASNAAILTQGTEVADFAEGVELYQATDMEGTGSAVTITIIYQIIRF